MHDVVVLVPITVFGVLGWVVWTITTNIRRSKATREIAELHSKLLDKCTGSQDLLGYLESEAGRRFLESASTTGTNPATRILNALQGGAILTLVGFALLRVHSSVEHPEFQQSLLIAGSVITAAGLGFLISAGASYFLCRSWGILLPSQIRP